MRAPTFVSLLAACVSAELPNLTSERENEPVEGLELLKREAVYNALPSEDSIEEINTRSGVVYELFQEDIILTKEQKELMAANLKGARFKRQAFNDEGWLARKWSDGVPYMLFLHDERTTTAFQKAAKLWMENTCINFTDYTDYSKRKPPTDILFVLGGDDGCKSYVGRNKGPGPQELTLGQGCGTLGHAAHEIGHTLGLFHTQTRYDRDNFIKVHKDNIKPLWYDQFDVQTTATSDNYNLTYDYGSIMHYAAKSSVVSIDREKPVMEAIDGNYTETLGSDIISFYDLLITNMLYDCLDACKDKTIQCQNDGFPHPRDCSKCICPSGYGGKFCETRPEGCGEEVEAKEEWQTLENKLDGINADDEPDGFKRCNYWIKAPNNRRIEIIIVALPDWYLDSGCKYTGLEIKAHSDKRLTGYRFCSKEDVNKKLLSNSNLLPVITYNRLEQNVSTTLKYRYV